MSEQETDRLIREIRQQLRCPVCGLPPDHRLDWAALSRAALQDRPAGQDGSR